MRIEMQYPFILGNELCDGTKHMIEPIDLKGFMINGGELLLLTYEDKKYNCTAYTILRKEGSKFYKVPLHDYEELDEKIKNGQIKLSNKSLSILNGVLSISTDKPINKVSDFGKNSSINNRIKWQDENAEKENRLQIIKDTCKIIIEAIAWRKGSFDIPLQLKQALDRLYIMDFDILSKQEFQALVSRLQKELKACIHTEKGIGIIVFGPSKLDIPRATRVILDIVSDLLEKKEKNFSKPSDTFVAKKASDDDWRYPPKSLNPSYVSEDNNYLTKELIPDDRLKKRINKDKTACIVLPPDFSDENLSVKNRMLPIFMMEEAIIDETKRKIEYGPEHFGILKNDFNSKKNLFNRNSLVDVINTVSKTNDSKGFVLGPFSSKDIKDIINIIISKDAEEYYFVVCDSREKYDNIFKSSSIEVYYPEEASSYKYENSLERKVFVEGIIGTPEYIVKYNSSGFDIGGGDNLISPKRR